MLKGFEPKPERVHVQMLQGSRRQVVVFTLDLTNLACDIDQVVRIVQQFLELFLQAFPLRHELGKDDFTRFCNKFKLKKNLIARRGFNRLTQPDSFSKAECSVRLTNCLEQANITLLQAVLMTKDELLDVRRFGETTFIELQEKASKYSNLDLRWE